LLHQSSLLQGMVRLIHSRHHIDLLATVNKYLNKCNSYELPYHNKHLFLANYLH
jgi:hypothetical protein